MPNQMSLFDFEEPSEELPPVRANSQALSGRLLTLFFGLLPEPADAQAIAQHAAGWHRQLQVGGALRPAHLLHVSLQAIGGYAGKVPVQSVEFGRRIGSAMSAPPFDVVFDRVMGFKGENSPFVLLVGEGQAHLQAFRYELGMLIANAGGDRRASTFTPHMTLAYGQQVVPEHPITPIRWTVREFALIVSHYGESHYDVLFNWPLRD